MTDDEIRKLVRAKLADGALPREPPRMVPVVPGQSTQYMATFGRPQPDPCAICGKGSTQITYNFPERAIQAVHFHERCAAVWREEAGKAW